MLGPIEQLIAGYQTFRQRYAESDGASYQQFAQNASKVLMIACIDSRVDPAFVLNCKPGDLFVLRNVANLVPPCQEGGGYHGVSAALEFGVQTLGVQHIIVFGHTNCGGIKELLRTREGPLQNKSFVTGWMHIADSARQQTLHDHAHLDANDLAEQCERYCLINSYNNLLTFPWIKEKVQQQHLMLHAWYFDLQSGIIQAFDQHQQTFHPLEDFYQPQAPDTQST